VYEAQLTQKTRNHWHHRQATYNLVRVLEILWLTTHNRRVNLNFLFLTHGDLVFAGRWEFFSVSPLTRQWPFYIMRCASPWLSSPKTGRRAIHYQDRAVCGRDLNSYIRNSEFCMACSHTSTMLRGRGVANEALNRIFFERRIPMLSMRCNRLFARSGRHSRASCVWKYEDDAYLAGIRYGAVYM
jgi:hypothetical protein